MSAPASPGPLGDCLRAGFARHRTYAPRYGWLLRFHQALLEDPATVTRPDAPVLLGTGSSMVAAMAFWSQAFGLSHHHPAAERGVLAPTARGHWLLDESGADPYLELEPTLWLLHYWLVSAPCRVPTWHYLFGHCGASRISRSQLVERVQLAAAESGWPRPSGAAVDRDVACLVSMYGPRQNGSRPESLEELVDHPFRALNLIDTQDGDPGAGPGSQVLVAHSWAGRSAPPGVIVYACLDYAARTCPDRPGSVTVDRLAHEPGAPGRLLRVPRSVLVAALERLSAIHGNAFEVIESGDGHQALVFRRPPSLLADQVLGRLYSAAAGPVPQERDRQMARPVGPPPGAR
ncbi:DUF4007 family protein [Streptacidiphilus sp. EB103A]|uniref:DUF4007 family protein n=1 Tax=Streptacidiphilus sp. EB103A TaxID=3156275 RepID=UPI0035123D54